ncbi:MAG TPA: YceI family protein [Myxococcaceae bacterium]|nr:YceI family protein [Myxococcaceae bacterium]
MRSFVAALAALVALPAAASTWQVDPNHTESSFVVKHMMVSNVRGQFGKTTGTIFQDDKDITKSRAEITIDTTTIDTRVAQRDAHLKSPDFFDVAKFPTITFKSTKITKGEGNTLKAEGDLTIHGVTKPVVLNVEFTPETLAGGKTRRGLTATTKVNRKDFGLMWNKAIEAGGVMVGDEAKLTVEMELVKQDAPTATK